MTLDSLLDEYDLTLDDIRWYLSSLLTQSLLATADKPEDITRRIWSGALEGELYDMEERYLAGLAEDLGRGITDQNAVRDQLERARLLKLHRPR